MSRWSQGLGATELVWHRANREADLIEFLASGVRWAECDARLDPQGVVRVSHEPLDGTSGLELAEWLGAVRSEGRSAKIDLKEGGPVIEAALGDVSRVRFHDDDLWFNAAVEILGGEAGCRRLADAHPGARLSCPLDTLASYLLVVPPAYEVIDLLGAWGLNWLCFGCRVPGVESLVPAVQEGGWPVNIWEVKDADDLERALSLGPEAITADLGSIDPSSSERTKVMTPKPDRAAVSQPRCACSSAGCGAARAVRDGPAAGHSGRKGPGPSVSAARYRPMPAAYVAMLEHDRRRESLRVCRAAWLLGVTVRE